MTREERKKNNYRLTDEEKSEIVRLHENGITMNEISKQFFVSRKNISKILIEFNYEPRIIKNLNDEEKLEIARLYRQGFNIKQLEKKFNKGQEVISKILKEQNETIRRRKLTEEEKLEIVKLYLEGFSPREISRNLKKAEKKIYDILYSAAADGFIEINRKNVNLIGMRFHKLIVIEKSSKRGRDIYWKCLCDCGKITIVNTARLNSGKTKSCGCLKIESVKERFTKHGHCINKKQSIVYSMYVDAKRRAKDLNLPFDLELEDINVPTYCPIFPNIKLEPNIGNHKDGSPSLDRLIPERGYVKGNISVISWKANRLKSNATLDELQKLTNWLEKELQDK